MKRRWRFLQGFECPPSFLSRSFYNNPGSVGSQRGHRASFRSRKHGRVADLGLLSSQRCAPGRPAAPPDWRAARGYVAGAGVSQLTRTSPLPHPPPRTPTQRARCPSSRLFLPSPDFRSSVCASGHSVASARRTPEALPAQLSLLFTACSCA